MRLSCVSIIKANLHRVSCRPILYSYSIPVLLRMHINTLISTVFVLFSNSM